MYNSLLFILCVISLEISLVAETDAESLAAEEKARKAGLAAGLQFAYINAPADAAGAQAPTLPKQVRPLLFKILVQITNLIRVSHKLIMCRMRFSSTIGRMYKYFVYCIVYCKFILRRLRAGDGGARIRCRRREPRGLNGSDEEALTFCELPSWFPQIDS